ncbi:MAG: metalloregulator ArsR/SmtB family transcription factor [Thermoanaerobaculia bacterium]
MNRKLELSPAAISLVAARFKVMGEPFRLRLLQALDRGEKSISALAEELEASQPSVSKHIKILHDSGLIARRQEGNTVYCSIADTTVFELCDVVCSSLRQRIAQQNQSLSPRRSARPTVGRR